MVRFNERLLTSGEHNENKKTTTGVNRSLFPEFLPLQTFLIISICSAILVISKCINELINMSE